VRRDHGGPWDLCEDDVLMCENLLDCSCTGIIETVAWECHEACVTDEDCADVAYCSIYTDKPNSCTLSFDFKDLCHKHSW